MKKPEILILDLPAPNLFAYISNLEHATETKVPILLSASTDDTVIFRIFASNRGKQKFLAELKAGDQFCTKSKIIVRLLGKSGIVSTTPTECTCLGKIDLVLFHHFSYG